MQSQTSHNGQIRGSGTGGKPNPAEPNRYYYHPDHLGSTSYITDATGEVYQHLEYFAFGETFVEEHSNTDRTPYLYNGKELDEETGLYYYGARYYDAQNSIMLSVDRFTEKYPGLTPYHYTANNPVNYVDVNGDSVWIKDNTIHMTGAVLDATGNHDADDLAEMITNELKDRLSQGLEDAGLNYKLDIDIRGVKSMDEVKDSDHLFAIVSDARDENGEKMGGGVGQYKRKRDGALIFGNTSLIDESVLSFNNTMTHEGGHFMGLDHIYDEYGNVDNSTSNPMGYINPYRAMILPWSWGDQRSDPFNASQVKIIIEAIKDRRVNKFGSYEKELRNVLRSSH